MDMNIVRAETCHLSECVQAVIHSEIGRVYGMSEEQMKKTLASAMERGEVFAAVDERNECLGFVRVALKGAFCRFPYLMLIAVREASRGKGVGNKLLAFFEEIGFAEADKVFLLVSHFNTRAQKLYEQVGYKSVGLLPGLILKDVDEVLMMKCRPRTSDL